MEQSSLQSLLEDLKSSFDYEKFRDSKKPVQSCDPFWADTFHRYYINVQGGRRERDDILFYVKLDSKDSETVEFLRRDSKSLPKRNDRTVLWEQTLYLNILMHEFTYHVSSATLTVKPKSDNVDQVMKKVMLQVYPSPTERRMDSKGKVAPVAYPNIVFCIDNFEDVFGDLYTSKKGEKVAVQLLAINERVRLEKLVFLGAIDHVTLMNSVDEKEQVSLGSKLKKQLSLRSKSGKVYSAQTSYHFIQMRGPKLKGFAEMAVIRRDISYLEQPGIFTTSADSHSSLSDSHSEASASHSKTVLQQQTFAHQTSRSANGNQQASPSNNLAVNEGGTSEGGTLQGGSYSPKLRQAFMGQSSTTIPTQERYSASPVSRGSCSSQTGLLRSSSSTRDHEEEEGEEGDMEGACQSDTVDNNGGVFDEDDGEGGAVFKAYGGSPSKLAAGSSSHQTRSKFKTRESMKDLLRSFAKGTKKHKAESDGDLMFAYLTYLQLPWYVLMEDVLNGTKQKAL